MAIVSKNPIFGIDYIPGEHRPLECCEHCGKVFTVKVDGIEWPQSTKAPFAISDYGFWYCDNDDQCLDAHIDDCKLIAGGV